MLKCVAQLLEVAHCIVECAYVDAGTVVVPVAQEDTGFTSTGLCLLDEPDYELFAVYVVLTAIVFVAKVNVSETRGFLE
jgi:hypothetical protein